VNVLKPELLTTIRTLLAQGATQREIERFTGVDRKTIRRYQRAANSSGVATGSAATAAGGTAAAGQIPPPRPPASATPSACAPHRVWIEAQVELGRNAVSIYQDLVEQHGFAHAYNSVKRFVAGLKRRAPERFDVLEFLPGEEAQVDYGLGAPTRHANGKYRRPYLFVMTLKYSGKSFRKVVWKTDQEVWARLHEEAFRALGGCCKYVVLDNLKEGVIRPDIYAPELNPVYAAMLAHYGVVADPCRVRDPNRKGTVENAIQHTQGTALKGRRFESIEAQNDWLAHWEERWAAPRIHGRKKRQVAELFGEERPHLQPLPATAFVLFRQGVRTVDDAGLVQVEGAYYAALPAAPTAKSRCASSPTASRSSTPAANCCAATLKPRAKAPSCSRRAIACSIPRARPPASWPRSLRSGPTPPRSPVNCSPAWAAPASGRSTASPNSRALTPAPTSRRCARGCSPPIASPTPRSNASSSVAPSPRRRP